MVPSPSWADQAVCRPLVVRLVSQDRGMAPAKVGFGPEAVRCPLRHQGGRWSQELAEDCPPRSLFVVVGVGKRLGDPTDFALGPSHLYRERMVQRYLKRKTLNKRKVSL